MFWFISGIIVTIVVAIMLAYNVDEEEFECRPRQLLALCCGDSGTELA